MPGCASVVGALEGIAGRGPDIISGKPSVRFIQAFAATHQINPHDCIVVGDTWDSDIALAQNLGAPAVWIQSRAASAPTHPIPNNVYVRTSLLEFARDLLY